MSLRVWLPLNGDLKNQGLSDVTVTNNEAIVDNGGKIGKCYKFQNSNYISLNKKCCDIFNDGDSFSMCMWVKILSFPANTSGDNSRSGIGGCNLYSSETSTVNGTTVYGGGFGLQYTYNGALTACLYPFSGTFTINGGTLSLNTWTHVCITFDKLTKIFSAYKDGTLISSNTMNSNSVWGANGKQFTFGQATQGGWNGVRDKMLNDIRIYDHCLTASEVKEISKGLVCHYTLGSESVLPAITNYASNSGPSGWDNSGSASRNSNETTYGKPLGNLPVYSITTTTAGEQCITFGNIGSTNATTLRGKLITASCWIYIVGSNIYNSTPYLRSGKYNNTIASFKYNGNGSIQLWPKNRWIKIEGTGTITSDETEAYFCNYLGLSGEIRAFSGWQIENYNLSTPYIAPGTSRSPGLVYDSSGYSRNLTITGNVNAADSIRYNKAIHTNSGSNYFSADVPCLGDVFTISGWFKNTGSQNYKPLFWWGNNTTSRGVCLHGDTSGRLEGGNGTNLFDVTLNGLSNNTWYHVILVYDGSTIKRYLNGEVNGSYSFSYKFLGVMDKFYLNYFWGSNRIGDVSDVRLYATALSADDVLALYKLGLV